MAIKIIKNNWVWAGTLSPRPSTEYIVLHHAGASKCSATDIDQWHKNNGWIGIGYHFFITKKGECYEGRPLDKLGAHCTGFNSRSIGICFEGDFETETLTDVQKRTSIELLKYLNKIYPNAILKRHKDLFNTACPGKKFPFEEIKKGAIDTAKELTSGNDIVWELMHGKHQVPIDDVARAVKAVDRAKSNAEFSSLYWILRKIANNITN